jgi:hypothetical protein
MPRSGKFIIYTTRDIIVRNFPNCYAAIERFRDRLKKRVETASGLIPWFTLYRPRRRKLFDLQKILIRQTSDRVRAAFDDNGWYCLKSAIIVQLRDEVCLSYKYLLALLNSKLTDYLYQDLVGEQARVFPEVKPVQLFKLPLRIIDFANPADKERHGRLVGLVDQMLSAKKRLAAAKTDSDKDFYQNKCAGLDRHIDTLVYELYGLTPEEIQIVERAQPGSAKSQEPKSRVRETSLPFKSGLKAEARGTAQPDLFGGVGGGNQ